MNATRWIGVAAAAVLPLGLVGLAGASARGTGGGAGARTQVDVQAQGADRGEADQDARTEEGSASGRLVRIGEREPAAEADGFDGKRWRDELTSSDLDRREASYARLLEIARRSPAARAALDTWAAGSDELAWTARMARRELGRTGGFGWLGGGPNALQGRRGTGLFGGQELQERLREIESLLSDMRAGTDAWAMQGFPDASGWPGTGRVPGASEKRQSYSIEVGPDGARVKVEDEVDGDRETREYEGETLDEILRANPELEDRIQVRAFDLDGESLFGKLLDRDLADLWQDVARPPAGLALGAPPTDILGIEYEAPSPEQVDRADLAPGLGLSVLRTVPGTIAHILGLKRGDVVVELNQIPVYEGDDVSRVLKERLPDAPVAVTIVDSKGKRRTLTWKPSLAPR